MAKRGRRRRGQGQGMPSSAPAPAGEDDSPGAGDVLCCALCRRVVDRTTVHHLIPRARGGRHGPTARLCPTCHRQAHALFSETTLAEELYSVELLRANPRIAAFLKWMRRQRGASFAVRRARERG